MMFNNTNLTKLITSKSNNCSNYLKKTKIYSVKDKHAVNNAIELLNNGNVIALPTDTVYGLACNANNPEAIQKLYSIKNRERIKPIAICVPDLKTLKFYGNSIHLKDEMLNLLLPGAITIVLEKTENLNNPDLNPGISKIGIRIPKYDFIQNLCDKLKYPLALTSANLSYEKSSLNINEFENIWPQLAGIFDDGQLGLIEELRNASTVIDLSCSKYYKVLRKGISLEYTTKIIKTFNLTEYNEI